MAERDALVEALLEAHGRTYASEAGIRLQRNTPAPLFQLLCLSLLISARISASAAVSAARALFDAGWTTPEKMAAATWEDRTRVLNESGYARYDESSSRYLAATAETVMDRWNGDLRKVRDRADGDPEVVREQLSACKGIGAVGADVFLREAQTQWVEFVPFVDGRTAESAAGLGLPRAGDELIELVDGSAERFGELLAALVRSDLAGDHDEIAQRAS